MFIQKKIFFGLLFIYSGLSWAGPKFTPDYYKDIKPIFDSRCIQCHSCFNSPCQLKFSSPDGIRRGLIQNYNVYDTTRIRAYSPTRLNMDANSTAEWHHGTWHKALNTNIKRYSKGHVKIPSRYDQKFYSVIPTAKDPNNKMIVTLLEERLNNPAQVDDFTYFRELQPENSNICPKNDSELEKHIAKRSHDFGTSAGMPYGLPALSSKQIETLKLWIDAGAPLPTEGQYEKHILDKVSLDEVKIKSVEKFFNQKGLKQRLVSRYIFEHLFSGHIYLDKSASSGQFYEIIRTYNSCSTTKKVTALSSRRPWGESSDDEIKINYCLRPIEETITHKNHIVYLLDQKKIERLDQLFYKNQKYEVSKLPERDDKFASNPFKTFTDIPIKIRYQFLLDDSQYFVRSFIRGPVCKSNSATNSIDEQFYVLFLDPKKDPMVLDKDLEKIAINNLDLPAKKGSEQIGVGIEFGHEIHKQRNEYLDARAQSIQKSMPKGYKISDLWNGKNTSDYQIPNKNTNLTVFRNYESAAVVQGLIGPTSKTIFVLDYAILERLYYLLVSGYDVFADFNHHLQSRLYMSYLRMEAENLFLMFLPQNIRQPLRDTWYIPGFGPTEIALKDKVNKVYPLRGLDIPSAESYKEVDADFIEEKIQKARNPHLNAYRPNGSPMEYQNLSPKVELDQTLYVYKKQFMEKTKAHLGSSLAYNDTINRESNRYGIPSLTLNTPSEIKNNIKTIAEFENEFAKIVAQPARVSSWTLKMPSLSYLLVEDGDQRSIYTLIRQKEHFNIAWIAGEEGRRNHNDDSIYIYKGILGSYPNMIFRTSIEDAGQFLDRLQRLNSHDKDDYSNLVKDFGSPRSGQGSERFWDNYDDLHTAFKAQSPIEFGYLDLNRYGIDYRYADDNSPMHYSKHRACFEAFNLILTGEYDGGSDKKLNSILGTISSSLKECF